MQLFRPEFNNRFLAFSRVSALWPTRISSCWDAFLCFPAACRPLQCRGYDNAAHTGDGMAAVP
jgi:hypothetical protein